MNTNLCADLSKRLVHNHSDMEDVIVLGNSNRSIASTGMNNLSSRSHAIFTICFTQVNCNVFKLISEATSYVTKCLKFPQHSLLYLCCLFFKNILRTTCLQMLLPLS